MEKENSVKTVWNNVPVVKTKLVVKAVKMNQEILLTVYVEIIDMLLMNKVVELVTLIVKLVMDLMITTVLLVKRVMLKLNLEHVFWPPNLSKLKI